MKDALPPNPPRNDDDETAEPSDDQGMKGALAMPTPEAVGEADGIELPKM